ncbi:GntR family transcriptional regulator, partial [Streptomyces sp. NPDC127044]
MARTTSPTGTHPSDQEPRYARIAAQLLGELRDGTVPP